MEAVADPIAELFERESEIDRIAALLDAARSGHGSLLVIEGPAGIGKTRLLEAARDTASAEGMNVLEARGSDLERVIPFGVVRQLFAGRSALLEGPAELCAPVFGDAAGAERTDAILHGLYWLTSNLAERAPLLLCVDDAHWSDPSSLRFLHYLGRRVGDLPMLVAVTMRPAEPEARVDVPGHIRAEPSAALLRPAPLSPDAVAALVRADLAEHAAPELCDACHAATGGNPFLVRELVAALRADGVAPTAERVARTVPETVSRHVLARLARLPSAAAELARAVVLLGKDVELPLAARLVDLDLGDAGAAADALARAELVRPGLPLEFVHPLAREAVYAELPESARALLHMRAARLLEEAGAPAYRVAAQLVAAPSVHEPWVVSVLRRAATAALAAGAPESAAAYLRRVLEEPPEPEVRAEVVFELAQAEALVNGPAATDRLAEALELEPDPARRAPIAELLARRLSFDARPRESSAVSAGALRDLGDAHPELRARLEAELLNVAMYEPAMADVVADLVPRARAAPPEERGVGACALLGMSAFVDARAGRPAAEVAERAERALQGGALMAAANGGAAHMQAAFVLAAADSDLAPAVHADGLAQARKTGDVFAFAANKIFASHAHACRGELADAVADGSAGMEATEAYDVGIGPAWACAFVAGALMDRGDLAAAWRTIERAGAPEEVPESAHWHWLLDARARLLFQSGDARRALVETLECGRRFEAVGGRNPAFMPWRSRAALCLTRLGEDARRARALAEEEVELARAFGAPRALGRALRVRALVTGAGLPSRRAAVDVLEPSPARLELARALFDLGTATSHAGRPEAAREPLRRALELARRCGAVPLQARAHEALLAVGDRPRAEPAAGPDALTSAERRVAVMAADGLSNREIAAELFLGLKTVEMHLSRVYRKLDLRSRSQLPRALA
jgi:DNA-binding CsgD family transcriptional regulator